MDKGEGHELGEPARLPLERPGPGEMAGPRTGVFDGPEHDGHVRPQSHTVSGPVGVEPLLGVDLVGAENGPDFVIENLGCRAGKGLEAGIAEGRKIGGQRDTVALGSFGYFQSTKAMNVNRLGRFSAGFDHLEVEITVEFRVDTSLKTDFSGAAIFGLANPIGDFAELQQIGVASQVEGQRALGERAELAFEGAYVGVVDVAIEDERHFVADDLGPKRVSYGGDGTDLRTTGTEERHDLVLVHLLAGLHGCQHFANRAPGGGEGHHQWFPNHRSGEEAEELRWERLSS